MKLGLRKLFGLGGKRSKKRKHGNMPAAPKLVATAYVGSFEVRVYETAGGRYFPRVSGVSGGSHSSIREATAEGRRMAEQQSTRLAAYTRGRGTRRGTRGRRR